jgi:hypothetical protein
LITIESLLSITVKWNQASETMDENTANLVATLSKLALDTPTTAAALVQVLHANCLTIHIQEGALETLKTALLGDGVTLASFSKIANVKFEVSDSCAVSFLEFIRSFNIKQMSWTGTTEDEIHAFVELGVSGLLNMYFGTQLVVTRNNKIQTSSGRADYSVSKNRKQLLRGEDKLAELAKSQDPEQELLDKSPNAEEWKRFYGDAQYIFGYYCIGAPKNLALQFVCITSDGKVVKLTKEPFNLCTFAGMLACRFFCASLCPYLLALVDLINVDIGWDWTLQRAAEGYPWQSCRLAIGLTEKGNACLLKEWTFKTRPKAHADNFTKVCFGFVQNPP